MAHPDMSHISFTYPPAASMWVVTLHYLLCNQTHPLPLHPPSYWLRLFLSQTFSYMVTPTFLKSSHSTPTCLWRWNSVLKRRHTKFRSRGITEKTTYNTVLPLSIGHQNLQPGGFKLKVICLHMSRHYFQTITEPEGSKHENILH
jgi:hypothetical protein